MNNIVMIDINKLYPHPDNPRKELGDLSELADSIKARGVMQNLTVIPRGYGTEEKYTVIIGHRRLAASKLAGLTEVPCVVTHMTEREQLATMLLENMQRSDLTVYEQAQGFQLMIDLGESVKDIADKTGFSETTVRRRVKLMRYDESVMREAQAKQATIDDYMKLAEIENVSEANDILRFIGTRNFDEKIASALRRQREAKEREECRELIARYAKKLEDASWEAIRDGGYITVKNIYPGQLKEDDIKELKAKHGKVYFSEGYGFTIYRDSTAEDDAAEAAADVKRNARSELESRAKKMQKDIEARAEEFVENYRSRSTDIGIIMFDLAAAVIEHRITYDYKFWEFMSSINFELNENEHQWDTTAHDRAEAAAILRLGSEGKIELDTVLKLIWYMTERHDVAYLHYNCTKLTHNCTALKNRLELLEKLGYNVSDEEWAFVLGTHPIYNEEIEL